LPLITWKIGNEPNELIDLAKEISRENAEINWVSTCDKGMRGMR
jgi:hypothetical protein